MDLWYGVSISSLIIIMVGKEHGLDLRMPRDDMVIDVNVHNV